MTRSRTTVLASLLAIGLALPVAARAQHKIFDKSSISSPAASDTSAYRFPSARSQVWTWAMNAAGPSALAGSAMSAAWGQWVLEDPPEWTGGDGYGRRFAIGMATTGITETSLAALSAAMGQDPGYYRSPRAGFGPRLGHALKMTVLARKRNGDAVFSPAKAASPFAGPLVTRITLYPERYTYLDGLVSGAAGVALNAGWNIAREFILKAPGWGGSAEGTRQVVDLPR